MTDPNLVIILERMQQNHNALIERMQQKHKALIERITGVREPLNPNKNRQQHDELSLNRNIPSRNNPPPNQKATIPMEKLTEQEDELVDRLVMVEESHEPDEEDDINTSTKNFETKLEVKADLLLPSKLLCSTNNDVIRSNYNDPFLQSGSTAESAGYSSTRKFFSMFFPSKFFPKKSAGYDGIRKFNRDYSVSWKSCSQTAQTVTIQVSNSTRIRVVLLVVTRVEPESVFVYNYKEVYKDKRKKTRTQGKNTSLRSSFHQPEEFDAVRLEDKSELPFRDGIRTVSRDGF
jgi:hypothetical protein